MLMYEYFIVLNCEKKKKIVFGTANSLQHSQLINLYFQYANFALLLTTLEKVTRNLSA